MILQTSCITEPPEDPSMLRLTRRLAVGWEDPLGLAIDGRADPALQAVARVATPHRIPDCGGAGFR